MELCIAMLSWGALPTLKATLETYQRNGLFDLPAQRIMFLQAMQYDEWDLGKKCGFDVLFTKENIGIGMAFKILLDYCKADKFIFLENDWQLIEPREKLQVQLDAGAKLLEIHPRSVIRYRHRKRYGEPLHTLQYKGNELSSLTHIGDCLFWKENPDIDFPQYFKRVEIDNQVFYQCSSKNSCYTNNPVMYKTDFLRSFIGPFCDKDIESPIQSWWEQQDINVFHGDGLFMHHRLQL